MRRFLGAILTAEVVTALCYRQRQRALRMLVVVWHQLNVDCPHSTQVFLALHVDEFLTKCLPGYAPWLKPDEQCHG